MEKPFNSPICLGKFKQNSDLFVYLLSDVANMVPLQTGVQ